MKAKAYVDGSYNASTRVYGAGAVLFLGEGTEPIFYPNQATIQPMSVLETWRVK